MDESYHLVQSSLPHFKEIKNLSPGHTFYSNLLPCSTALCCWPWLSHMEDMSEFVCVRLARRKPIYATLG